MRSSKPKLVGWGMAVCVLSLVTGCASLPEQPGLIDDVSGLMLSSVAESQQARVWPAAPEVPRYRYLGQLLGEQNYPPRQTTAWRRFGDWLVGLRQKPAQIRELQRPQSGLVTADGRILVTDVSRGAVYVFAGHQQRLEVWEMADDGMRFMTPIGIVQRSVKPAEQDSMEQPTSQFIVADADLARVVILNEGGEPTGSFGTGELIRPTGLARDAASGHIYVADSQAHDIKVYSDDGQLLRVIGQPGEGPGQFNGPTHLSFNGGRLYVSDTLNARVQIFDAAGHFLQTVGRRGLYVGDLPRPKGVAADAAGNIYVVETYYDYLLIFNNKGEFLLPIGGTGSAVGRFYLPAGVWSDAQDRIYVADTFNGRVVMFQYLGDQ